MSSKSIVYLLMFIGSAIGGYVPVLWGGSVFSYTSVVTTAIGGTIGVVIGYKLTV